MDNRGLACNWWDFAPETHSPFIQFRSPALWNSIRTSWNSFTVGTNRSCAQTVPQGIVNEAIKSVALLDQRVRCSGFGATSVGYRRRRRGPDSECCPGQPTGHRAINVNQKIITPHSRAAYLHLHECNVHGRVGNRPQIWVPPRSGEGIFKLYFIFVLLEAWWEVPRGARTWTKLLMKLSWNVVGLWDLWDLACWKGSLGRVIKVDYVDWTSK